MPQTIDAIMAALSETLATIAIPAGASARPSVSPEPPDNLDALPAFLCLERRTDIRALRTHSPRGPVEHYIDVYLLFAPAEQKYSMRARRIWTEPVLDALDQGEFGGARGLVETIDYGRAQLPSNEVFIATTFHLRITAERR